MISVTFPRGSPGGVVSVRCARPGRVIYAALAAIVSLGVAMIALASNSATLSRFVATPRGFCIASGVIFFLCWGWYKCSYIFLFPELPRPLIDWCNKAENLEARQQRASQALAFCKFPQEAQAYFLIFPDALLLWSQMPQALKNWFLDGSPGEDRTTRLLAAIEIAQCLEQKRSTLVLPDGLTSLPDLRDLRYVREVQLTDPVFSNLANLETLSGLKKLKIFSVGIVVLKDIPKLRCVVELQLRGGVIRSLEDIERLEGLKILSYKKCTIYLESNPPSLKWLEQLHFSDCEMGPLPVNVESLESLRKLTFRSVQGIAVLPSFSYLKSLQKLELNATWIRELPDLSELENLDSLCIVRSPVNSLPGLKNLQSLERIALIQTRMRVLPEDFQGLPRLHWTHLGKEFGSPKFITSSCHQVPTDNPDYDMYINPSKQIMWISLEEVSNNPLDVFGQWIAFGNIQPFEIHLLGSAGEGGGIKHQFYASLTQNLFREGALFTEFYKKLPAKVQQEKGKDLIWFGRLLSYMYRWNMLTGKILPDTFFEILQALKKEKGKQEEGERLSEEAYMKAYSGPLDVLLRGEENKFLREIKAHWEGKIAALPEATLCGFGEDPRQFSAEEIRRGTVRFLYAFLEPYLPCLKIAEEILDGISGPLERDLLRYPVFEVSSRLQGFLSAKKCIGAFRRNSDDPQVNQYIDWIEEYLLHKEKIGEFARIEDFMRYVTGSAIDDKTIITIGESNDESFRVTICSKTLSLPKLALSKEAFLELFEEHIKDHAFSMS